MDSAQILYGEMFDRDHTLVLETTENQTDYFELNDWNDFTLLLIGALSTNPCT